MGGVSTGSRSGAPSRKGCLVNHQTTKVSNKSEPSLPPLPPHSSIHPRTPLSPTMPLVPHLHHQLAPRLVACHSHEKRLRGIGPFRIERFKHGSRASDFSTIEEDDGKRIRLPEDVRFRETPCRQNRQKHLLLLWLSLLRSAGVSQKH